MEARQEQRGPCGAPKYPRLWIRERQVWGHEAFPTLA